jgi:hypothetical protein
MYPSNQRLRKEYRELEANLDYIARPSLKTNTHTHTKTETGATIGRTSAEACLQP